VDRLTLIGVSYRRGGLGAVELWQEHFSDDVLAEHGWEGFVQIATCNRWEAALHLPDGIDVDDARRLLTPTGYHRPYAYVGEAALEHLATVASSLDALNPGEDQILGQVRDAYRTAGERGQVSGLLRFAFDAALRTAKRVRREVELAPTETSLLSLARPDLAATLSEGGAAVVVGAGAMGGLAAKILADLGTEQLTIVNRDPARARRLAEPLRASVRLWDAFLADPGRARVLVCATPVRHLLDAPLLQNIEGLELIVDVGVPQNVDPRVAADLGVRVLDIAALERAGQARRRALGEKLAQAEGVIVEEVTLHLATWQERSLAPSIRALQAWIDETVAATLDEMSAGGSPALTREERARLVRRLAHVPVKGLRALAREYGADAARVFLAETGLST
jgi:glutamyl-tRNA reductase